MNKVFLAQMCHLVRRSAYEPDAWACSTPQCGWIKCSLTAAGKVSSVCTLRCWNRCGLLNLGAWLAREDKQWSSKDRSITRQTMRLLDVENGTLELRVLCNPLQPWIGATISKHCLNATASIQSFHLPIVLNAAYSLTCRVYD